MNSSLIAETLLFTGPQALQKAEELAKTILDGALETHPDFHRLRPEGKIHPIAAIQGLIREMALPPYTSKWKLFLIEEAHQMLPPSSNALLKTLEEPPEDTLILLTSTEPGSLLPTIRSRCKTITTANRAESLPDLAPYFTLADSHCFGELFPLIKDFSITETTPFLQSLLKEGQKYTSHTQKLLENGETARIALERNVKPRNVLLHFLLSLFFVES